jgi:hypothetical protein
MGGGRETEYGQERHLKPEESHVPGLPGDVEKPQRRSDPTASHGPTAARVGRERQGLRADEPYG